VRLPGATTDYLKQYTPIVPKALGNIDKRLDIVRDTYIPGILDNKTALKTMRLDKRVPDVRNPRIFLKNRPDWMHD
jgi:hypothetical protein